MTSIVWKVKVQSDILAFSVWIFSLLLLIFVGTLFDFFFLNTTDQLHDPSNWDFLLFNIPGNIILQSES